MLSDREWVSSLRPGDYIGWGAYRAWRVVEVSPEGDWVKIHRRDSEMRTCKAPSLLAKLRADTAQQNRTYPRPVPPLGPSGVETPTASKVPAPQPLLFQPPPPLPLDHDRITACVYRLFDAKDQLLYVGSAYDPHERFKNHRKRQKWWPRVSRATYEWHPNRMLADLAEHTAIVYESPEMNYSGAHPHYKYRRSPSVRT